MSSDARLDRLRDVAGLVADQALLPVSRATEAMRRIEARVEAIAHRRQALMQAANDPTVAGPMLQQAERLRRMQADLIAELAHARVQLEQARSHAAKAVGRTQALEAVAKRKSRRTQH